MLRIVNVILSATVLAGVMACCCPCGAFPGFRPKPIIVPVEVPIPNPVNPLPDKKGNPPPVSDPAEEAVKKLNATVTRDNGQPGQPVVEVRFNFPAQFSDSDFVKLAAFARLRKLTTGQNDKFTGVGVKDLAGLQDLEYLDVGFSPINDTGMKHIANLKQLKVLKLINAKLTDVGMRDIAKLDKLEELTAIQMLLNGPGQNEPTDNAIRELGKLRGIRKLDLSNTNTADGSAKEFANLNQLNSLTLNGTQVTDAGILGLTKLNQLQELVVGFRVSLKTMSDVRKAIPGCKVTKR